MLARLNSSNRFETIAKDSWIVNHGNMLGLAMIGGDRQKCLCYWTCC
jgi:hypothetical protein